MQHHETYKGKRINRGLSRSSVGKCLNADINGTIGIARKVIGDAVIKTLIYSGTVLLPIRIPFSIIQKIT